MSFFSGSLVIIRGPRIRCINHENWDNPMTLDLVNFQPDNWCYPRTWWLFLCPVRIRGNLARLGKFFHKKQKQTPNPTPRHTSDESCLVWPLCMRVQQISVLESFYKWLTREKYAADSQPLIGHDYENFRSKLSMLEPEFLTFTMIPSPYSNPIPST